MCRSNGANQLANLPASVYDIKKNKKSGNIVNQKKSDPSNRRRFTRIPLSLEVSIRFDDINSFVSEFSSDLSVGGIFIKTQKPRKVGTEVKLSMNLQNGQKLIEATGRVVRVVLAGDAYSGATPGMAIKFMKLHPESKNIIKQCIEDQGSNSG